MSMRPHSSRLTGSAFSAVVLLASTARGEDAVSPNSQVARPRLQIGSLLGIIDSNKLSVDGRNRGDEGDGWIAGGSAAYAHGLLPHFSLVLLTRIAGELTDWAQMRDEQRTRVDLALGPEFWWCAVTRPTTVVVRLSVPAGPTWTWFQGGEVGPVRERYSTGHGFNIAGVGGIDMMWKHHGISVELAYLRHFTYMTHEGTLVPDPTVEGSEEYRFDQSSLVFGIGYSYRF